LINSDQPLEEAASAATPKARQPDRRSDQAAAEQHEAAEIAAVRPEERRLEALDLAPRLQLPVVLHRLVEDLHRLPLAAADGVTEADKEGRVRHLRPPGSGTARL
jgi:hypothetical protein